MNTTYYRNCLAGNIFHTKETPGIPEEYYLGLSATAPNADGTGVNEPSMGAGYARVKLTADVLGEPVDGVVSNTQMIGFNETTASWGTLTHFVIFDTDVVGSGNLLMFGELPYARTLDTSSILLFKEGDLKLSVQDPE